MRAVRNVRRSQAYNRGSRIWVVNFEALTSFGWRQVARYTLTSGVVCAAWFESAAEADVYIRGLTEVAR